MLHENHIKAGSPSLVSAHTTSTSGKSLPAVPVLKQKPKGQETPLQKKEEDIIQPQHDSGNGATVIQRKPSDWRNPAHASGVKISEVLQHEPGYFSTWKKIVAAINEYKALQENAYAQRTQKLDLMTTLIGTWKEGHKDDTTERVQGIRGVLPDLEELISDEQDELKFVFNTRQYTTSESQYTSKINRDVSFTVVKQGAKLNIVSDDPRIAGYIEYDLVGYSIQLKHFEAQPEGLGLGSVLMNEFAAFASSMGIAIVDVQMAALSAMGAYEAFGGVPRAGSQVAFAHRRGQYENVMGLRNNEQDGEHIAEDHDDDTYNNFINEEAKAIGNTKVNKAEFENPDIGKENLDRIRHEAEEAHKAKYVRNVPNVKRVARLKALSGFLSYNIAALLNKTAGMVASKWDMEY